MRAAIRINWTERELGWGERPDGTTLHRDKETAEKYVADYWARMPDQRPAEYSSPGDPYVVIVSEDLYTKVQQEGSFWVEPTRWPKDDDLATRSLA